MKAPQTPFSLMCSPQFVAAAAAADGEAKKLPTVRMVAYTGGPMRVSGWGPNPLIIALDGLAIPANVPLRFAHDGYELVGHSENIRVEGTKLLLDGVISFETARAKSIVTSAANGFPWQASVGVQPTEVRFVEAGQTMEINGSVRKGPFYAVTKGQLREVSIVDLGADPKTQTKIAAMATEASMDEDEKQTPPAGGSGNTHPTPTPPAPPVQAGANLDSIIGEARAEQQRQERITSMVRAACQAPGADLDALQRIGSEAIASKWSENQVELALLRASRAPMQVATHRSGGPPSDAVLAASLLMSCGMSHEKLVKDPDFGERTVEAAWKRYRGRMSLHQLIAASLQSHGIAVGHGGREIFSQLCAAAPMLAMQQARSAGHPDIAAAGFSTVSLAGILGTVGNKMLLDSFTSVATTWQDICQASDFNNFLTYTQYRLTASGGMRKVPKGGELKHVELGEESYTNRLETRGMTITLPREDIVNDDLGALQQLFRIIGRDAALALEEAVYDAFMESSDTIFTSARGNRLTSSALTLATLQSADAALMAQTNENGKPIYAMGDRIVVPPALRATADQLYTSQNVQSGSTAALGQPDSNPMRGRMRPIVSPFLSLSALAGSSATTWYLLTNPAMVPFLQAAFLQGRRAPTVETADAAFNTLGISMRGYFDFGVAVVDYRGAVKATA